MICVMLSDVKHLYVYLYQHVWCVLISLVEA